MVKSENSLVSPSVEFFKLPLSPKIPKPSAMAFFFSFYIWVLCLSLSSPLALSSTIHELLRAQGLPPGLLPREVKSYALSQNGLLEVFLEGPCLAKYENRVMFESVVRANLSYGSLIGVQGLTQEELFLWLPVKDIIVDDPKSGLILFDIGVAHKQLALSLFEDPPSCNPHDKGALRNRVRKERGFGALR